MVADHDENEAAMRAWAMQRTDLAPFVLHEAERHEHKKEIVGIASA